MAKNQNGEKRSIAIDVNGRPSRYPQTGGAEDQHIGIIGRLMYENRENILNHFFLRLEIKSAHGYVREVEVLPDSSYIIYGMNDQLQPRSILIDSNGRATRYPKSGDDRVDDNIGIIGTLMNNNREVILNHFPLSLSETLTLIEPQAGNLSNYQVSDSQKGTKSGGEIPYPLKPAQQFLSKLNVKESYSPLSTTKNGNPLELKGNPRVTIGSFDPNINSELVIIGARVDRLINSAKTYINNDLFPVDVYRQAVGS